MEFEYRKLKSTKAILELVSEYDGERNWYSITKGVDQLMLEKIPPTYHVVEELVKHSYLRREPPNDGNFGKLYLTDAGRELLQMLREEQLRDESGDGAHAERGT